jgi:hypothetical protein
MVTDSWSVAAELTAQYSVLHQFAVGACSRDDASVAKFHRRISVRHVRGLISTAFPQPFHRRLSLN